MPSPLPVACANRRALSSGLWISMVSPAFPSVRGVFAHRSSGSGRRGRACSMFKALLPFPPSVGPALTGAADPAVASGGSLTVLGVRGGAFHHRANDPIRPGAHRPPAEVPEDAGRLRHPRCSPISPQDPWPWVGAVMPCPADAAGGCCRAMRSGPGVITIQFNPCSPIGYLTGYLISYVSHTGSSAPIPGRDPAPLEDLA
jgi:hypothetical protein